MSSLVSLKSNVHLLLFCFFSVCFSISLHVCVCVSELSILWFSPWKLQIDCLKGQWQKIISKLGLITADAGALWWRGGRICWVVFNLISSLFSSLFTFVQETLLIFHQINLWWKSQTVQVEAVLLKCNYIPPVVQLHKVHGLCSLARIGPQGSQCHLTATPVSSAVSHLMWACGWRPSLCHIYLEAEALINRLWPRMAK